MRLPVSVQDFKRDQFPILIEALHHKTREVVWSVKIELPVEGNRVAVKIPQIAAAYGHPVAVRITFGNGDVVVKDLKKTN